MIIDFHTHVGQNQFVCANKEDLLQEMSKNNVDYAICFVLGNDVKERSIMLGQECSEEIFPFFRFDPKTITLEELEKNLPIFKGVKLHPRLEQFDPLDSSIQWVFETIEKYNLPVLIHTRKENNLNSDPDLILLVVERYPNINFIFGHFANGVESVFERLKDFPNLYIETSIVSSPVIIEMMVKKYGSRQILFGSDYPYSDQELEVQKILRANIHIEDKENILYRNALRVLGGIKLIEEDKRGD